MKKTVLLLSTLFVTCNLWAEEKQRPASEFNYNYADIDIIDFDDVDATGLRLLGSYDVDTNLAVVASLAFADGSNDTDITQLSAGVAYHQKLTGTELKKADFVVRAEIQRHEVERGRFEDDDTGLLLVGGIRTRLIDSVELYGEAGYTTTGDNGFVAELGGRYTISDSFQAKASLGFSDNDVLSIGVRYSY